jgi:hypothetical protein
MHPSLSISCEFERPLLPKVFMIFGRPDVVLTIFLDTASSPLYYITALTALFESIALIVDQHQPVVEKYYGKGKMQRVVARLLEECDRVVKGLIEGWEEERSIKRKAWFIAVTVDNPDLL